ncbi:MAG: DUF4859 domain-containing protein [Prevotella sp.]|nr:DUF4859 domain-containing protein [Prevotella sp.]
MKKLSYILSGLLIAGSSAFFSSCGDNKDFWGPHTLTDDEIAEQERQEEIKRQQRERIDADLILEYTVEFFLSGNSYDGAPVEIDMDKIASEFGVDKNALGTALNGEGGLDVVGFAIEGSTHADNMTSSNSGAYWGHWWDKDGNVKNWGDEAMVFAEFNYDAETGKGIFNVGQYPGHLVADQQVKFIEALKYQDKRVAIVITAIGRERGEVQATIVASNQLTLETAPNDTYATVAVEGFDADAALAALGAGSWDDVAWVCTNADGSYAQEYSADAPGFWYDKEGFSGAWGDDASVFATFQEGQILIGQMPGQMTAGSTVTINFSAMYDNKIVENIITVNIAAYEDPETAPEGEPESIEKEITLTKTWDADWGATEPFDVKEDLRQAFKMTTYQIFSALKSGEMKLWVGEVGADAGEDGLPQYTADAPGYWLGAEGQRVTWGEEAIVYLNLAISEESLEFISGNHPENCDPTGQTITTKFIVEKDGITATYNITIDVTAAAAAR